MFELSDRSKRWLRYLMANRKDIVSLAITFAGCYGLSHFANWHLFSLLIGASWGSLVVYAQWLWADYKRELEEYNRQTNGAPPQSNRPSGILLAHDREMATPADRAKLRLLWRPWRNNDRRHI
jgi:hypothetical protein